MKYQLRVIFKDDPTPYEAFNLPWYVLATELKALADRDFEHDDVVGVKIEEAS